MKINMELSPPLSTWKHIFLFAPMIQETSVKQLIYKINECKLYCFGLRY
jgi:hypothetical protein